MAEIVSDITIQLFKDVLLNNLECTEQEGMNKIASDYGVDVDLCNEVFTPMTTASIIIRRGSVVLSRDNISQLDEESFISMGENGVNSITLSLPEYDKLIDCLGVEKVASVVGDSVVFYNWYRNSNDSDLAILKDRNEYSKDVVVDDDNPFMKDE